MLGIIIIPTIFGSITGVLLLLVMSGHQSALPLDFALAYLLGGLIGFGLIVLLSPVLSPFHPER